MSEVQSKLLITGASGFIGRRLAALAAARGLPTRLATRTPDSMSAAGSDVVQTPALDGDADWMRVLQGIDAVAHCAARVHVLRERSVDPRSEYRRVNVDSTLRLARCAAIAGVRRFIFLSSIGVNGSETFGRPFRMEDPASPDTHYAWSKYEAEEGLRRLSHETGLEVVVLRPPLVYGYGAKGNWETLVRWVGSGVPLPLGAIHNKRSLMGVDNLVDLMLLCAHHPAAANRTFLVSDGEEISTTELVKAMAGALGRRLRLIPVPAAWLRFAARLSGRTDAVRKILGSLEIDSSASRRELGWSPPFTVAGGLRRFAADSIAGTEWTSGAPGACDP
jgi:nucleoside-diphosphate-sugar epimerase